MTDKKSLIEFLIFLEAEGVLTKTLSFSEITDKFLNKAQASNKVKAPEGYAGFTIADTQKKSITGK